MTSVTIPNSVTSIGRYAFYGCSSLTSIIVESGNTVYDSRNNCNAIIETSTNTLITGCKNTVIPNSVTSIGEGAFYNCSGLTSITIPEGVTSIGDYAFYYCVGLTSVTIPNSVTSIGYGAFYNCVGLTSITIPEGVTSIGSWAFYWCVGLTSVTIPNSVTSIGDYAFRVCSRLTSVTIPNSVTSIGVGAFSDCNGLTSIVVESGNTVYDSRDNCNAIIETSTNTLITGCKNTVIPNRVTSIGSFAFRGCIGLTSITIPNSVTSIGEYAFEGCIGLTSISIPSSVSSIGKYAFSGCSGLTSVTSLSTTPPTCGTSVFNNVSVGNITLEVPAESVSLYQIADTWKDFGTITAVSSASRSEASGIDVILADGDEVEYYNLQGVRVMNPSKGLYIKREGGKTSKVIL